MDDRVRHRLEVGHAAALGRGDAEHGQQEATGRAAHVPPERDGVVGRAEVHRCVGAADVPVAEQPSPPAAQLRGVRIRLGDELSDVARHHRLSRPLGRPPRSPEGSSTVHPTFSEGEPGGAVLLRGGERNDFHAGLDAAGARALAAGQRPQPGGADRAVAARVPRRVQPRVRGGVRRLRRAARPPRDGERQRVHLPPAAALRPARSGRAQGPRVDRGRVRSPRRRRRAGLRGAHLARRDAPLGRRAEAGVGRPPSRARRRPARARRRAAAGAHRGVHRVT